MSGRAPGRRLAKLYDEDFPEFVSKDLYADVQDARHERGSVVAWYGHAERGDRVEVR